MTTKACCIGHAARKGDSPVRWCTNAALHAASLGDLKRMVAAPAKGGDARLVFDEGLIKAYAVCAHHSFDVIKVNIDELVKDATGKENGLKR
jgi:hypothetical protein